MILEVIRDMEAPDRFREMVGATHDDGKRDFRPNGDVRIEEDIRAAAKDERHVLEYLARRTGRHSVQIERGNVGTGFHRRAIHPDSPQHIRHDRGSRERAVDDAERVMYSALARGLSFKVTMGSILTLTPPLIISRSDMARALDILEECLAELRANPA